MKLLIQIVFAVVFLFLAYILLAVALGFLIRIAIVVALLGLLALYIRSKLQAREEKFDPKHHKKLERAAEEKLKEMERNA